MPAFPSYQGLPVCVTGGAGFIGSHLVDGLVAAGAKVSVIDDLSNGRTENLASVCDGITLIIGSILDDRALEAAMKGAAVVFHEAALGSVPGSVDDPVSYQEVNSTGTLRVLEAARRHKVKRVVYAASSAAYGEQPALPKVESMPPDTLSPYAATKLAAEFHLRAYANCYGLETLSLRYFNIFGPRQRPDSPYAAVIPMFAKALREGRRPVIFGDGSQTRDFTYVANVVHANLLAGSVQKPLKGEAINIACGRRYSLLHLLKVMAEALGVKADAEFAPPRAGDVQHSEASIAAARALIGYEPVVSFEDGMKQTLAS